MAEGLAPALRLEMRGIRKSFGATVALDGVDLEVFPGEVLALVGENGAGKSTLMKVLSGALEADAGAMRLEGRPYRPRGPLDARLTGVAMIYQELSLAPHLTVEENVMLGMEPSRGGLLRRGEMRRRTAEALEQLHHPEIDPRIPVRSLSIAARQVVEIARALAVGCRVLVLDEPTSSLTLQDAEQLFALIGRLKEQGHAIVYISHFIEEVKRVADRFTVLRDGRTVGGGAVAPITPSQIVDLMIGRRVDQLYPRRPRAPGEAILEVTGLSGVEKPDAAAFTLHRGEVLGIAGLMGAGRTELLRAIFGLDPLRSGKVRLGACMGPASPARRWAQGMGMLSEDRKSEGLALPLDIAANVTLSMGGGWVRPSRLDEAAGRWIERLGIRCRGPRQGVAELSGGNQQKVALARLLHHDVDVLLLDEPTRGIDVGSKAQIHGVIDELAYAGRAILVVSSSLPELLGVCDRIAVMCRGKLGPPRPAAECTEHQLLLEATGGEKAA